MDDETRQALLLFNRRAEAAEAEAELARKLIRAEKGKDQATEALKQAQDSGSGAETVAAAEAEWRTALDRWQKLTDGEDPDATEEPEDEPTEEPEDEPTEEPGLEGRVVGRPERHRGAQPSERWGRRR